MKYFAEFLINKGTVTSKDVVEAFLDQILYLPPIPKLVYDKQLLNPDQILKSFNTQQDDNIDFVSACKKNGFWTEEVNAQIENIYNEIRVPLGQFLIQGGSIDIKTLVKSLDEYLSQVEKPAPKSNPVKTDAKETKEIKEVKPQNQVSANENQLAFKINPLAASAAQEVTSFYNESKNNEMGNLLILVKQNITVKEISQEFLQDILKNIQTLKGLARFSKTEIMDHLCNSMITLLTNYMRSTYFGSQDIGLICCDTLNTGLALIYDLRNSIVESNSEGQFWNNEQQKIKLDQWTTTTIKILNQFQGAA